MKGKGGGRFKHYNVDGDVPLCLKKPNKTAKTAAAAITKKNECGSSTLNNTKEGSKSKMTSGSKDTCGDSTGEKHIESEKTKNKDVTFIVLQKHEINAQRQDKSEIWETHHDHIFMDEKSDHIVGEEHHERCAHSDEEAGSFLLHVSSDMKEKEKDDEEACETAAAKEIEEVSKEDVRRLIEERRNTPKEDKQRRKGVSKCVKMYLRQKHEKTARYPKNIRRLQRCKEHPRNQFCKEKSSHHQDKE